MLIGLTLGLVLAIIVLNVDKKLWLPLELETLNGRNTSCCKKSDKEQNYKNKVAVILFDDKTQFLLRQNGAPIKDFEKKGRDLIRQAVVKLESYGVKSIGINLNLTGSSVKEIDDKLSGTISSFKNIVIANSIYYSPSYSGDKILNSTHALGFGELYADYDKIVHKIKLTERSQNNISSFSYALFKTSFEDDLPEKLKEKNEFYIKYQKELIRKYSFVDLINGKIPKRDFKDKVVILGIGLKSKLMQYELYSPFSKKNYLSDSEVQAQAVSNLLNNSYLYKFGLNDYPFLFVLMSMFMGTLFSSLKTVRRLTVGAVFFIGAVCLSQVAYNYYHYAFEIIPILFLILGNLIIGSFIFLQLDLQDQNIELERAFNMLSKRSDELEASRAQLQNRNVQLTNILAELHVRVNELKEVRMQLSHRSEDERKRIARELHDDTLARITDVKRHIESVLNSRDLSVTPKKELGVCIQIMDNITHEIRRIINALRPSMLDNVLGLIPAIENLLDELTKRSNYKIQTKLITDISNLKLPEIKEINLYRVIQEALNNVYKHSGATMVEITIKQQPGQILFLISDNGIGFNGQAVNVKENILKKSGFGLVDMKERIELIGAKIQYIKKPEGAGTMLEIVLPVDVKKEIQATSK